MVKMSTLPERLSSVVILLLFLAGASGLQAQSQPLDLTASMGLFPYDTQSVRDVETRSSEALAAVAADRALPLVQRDQALWNLIHRRWASIEPLLVTLSQQDPLPQIRRSAAWGLLKLGYQSSLNQAAVAGDDGNTRSWKLHLQREAARSVVPFESRSFQAASNASFDVTVPLQVEGVVQFHDEKGDWYSMTISPSARADAVGEMTAAVNFATFQNRLVIQKRIADIQGSGHDFIEGYLFKGLTRPNGPNRFVHYYESIWSHPFYPSGRAGDDSQGTRNVQTHLFRTAETHLASQPGVLMPFPQSVRGIFYGAVSMNTAILQNPNMPLDGILQIVSLTEDNPMVANGFFYGTFRGIPEDVNGDGTVDINGVELFVDTNGTVLQRFPPSTSAAVKTTAPGEIPAAAMTASPASPRLP